MTRLHVVLMGSPGSGKTTQCDRLKDYFYHHQQQLVVYEMSQVLKRYAASSTDSNVLNEEERNQVNQLITSGKLKTQLPVDIIRKVQEHYLQEQQQHGIWVYYGGPYSVEQARVLMRPDLIIVLEFESDDIVIDRICNRRVDTLTGKTYHLQRDKHEMSQLAPQRLRCRLGDDPVLFTSRLNRYKKRCGSIIEYYESDCCCPVMRVDASQSMELVTEKIIEKIKPLLQEELE